MDHDDARIEATKESSNAYVKVNILSGEDQHSTNQEAPPMLYLPRLQQRTVFSLISISATSSRVLRGMQHQKLYILEELVSSRQHSVYFTPRLEMSETWLKWLIIRLRFF
jgi:hypothetical protein